MVSTVKKLTTYFQLSRPMVCLIAALMALEGYWLATHQFKLNLQMLFAALATGIAYGWSNVINDIFDLEIDRINSPQRPLPTGRMTLVEARWLSLGLLVACLLLSYLAGWPMFRLTVLLLIISFLYNAWAKKVPILGKLIVATLSVMTLAAGYFVAVDGDFPLIPVLVGFLFLLAREFIDTVSDAAGDERGGRVSINMLWGEKWVFILCLTLVILAGILLLMPTFTVDLSAPGLYLITILFLSIGPVFVGVAAIWRDHSPANIYRISTNMRYVLLSSLLSLLWLV